MPLPIHRIHPFPQFLPTLKKRQFLEFYLNLYSSSFFRLTNLLKSSIALITDITRYGLWKLIDVSW